MSTKVKKRALALLLCAVALWPAAHHALVRAYDIDAWKLFGFAMYAVPPRQVRVRVLPVEGGEPRPWVFSRPGREAIAAFIDRRLHWGRLATAEELGRRLLAVEPGFRVLEVRIQTRRLDLRDARIRFDEERVRVRRDG